MTTASKKPAPTSETPEVVSRPVIEESALFRTEMEKRRAEVAGAIDLIDASEIQANADCERAIALLREKRAAEAASQSDRRADLERVQAGCVAALNASEKSASNVVPISGQSAA